MDRNTATGLILISVMLILYFQFFSPTTPPPPPAETEASSPTQTDDASSSETQLGPQLSPAPESQDAVADQVRIERFGEFAPAATGIENEVSFENSDMEIKWSTHGAGIQQVRLKEFLTYHKEPLVILDTESSNFSFLLTGPGQIIDLHDLFYTNSQTRKGDTTFIRFSAALGNGKSVEQVYSVPAAGYDVGYQVKLSGLDKYLENGASYQWINKMKNLEKDVTTSRQRATLNYFTLEDGYDGFTERSTDLEEENLSATKWVAFKQHFFTSAVVANDRFSSGYVSTDVDEESEVVKTGKALLKFNSTQMIDGVRFHYYFGPNNYQILKKVAPGFDKNIYLGWPPVNVINKFVIIPIFNFLENYIASYGLIIIILVVVIKLFLSPLSYKSYVSMAKTKVLKPELDELKSQFPDDTQRQQKEQMKLYQQVGVNPLSGCIPVLLQMPVLFAMFYFFPSSIELRQQSFLWADDLSTYDSIATLPFTIPFYGNHVSLFVLLMTASTILYTWSNNQMTTMQGPMKTMTYFMPVIFMFVLNSFPAALSFYYFVSNLVTFGQQALIKRFVDEDKIRAVLDENRKKNKNKKKSKFQLKLDEAMKSSESQRKKRK